MSPPHGVVDCSSICNCGISLVIHTASLLEWNSFRNSEFPYCPNFSKSQSNPT